ncbi:Mg(2+) transport ATPase protein C [Labilithrix luteola]|uniref:Mg(2+) transport ATPase protein C n=1 Tax=Labilithrix luteola TaxID=1391654 RepID=A0A0K1PPU7_9BACT|nr:MgtC/SapB family protein [Labilithrix luteola]AKU95144.1 Mg(2+) transport ATPase protein C [Labilithrix luteola]
MLATGALVARIAVGAALGGVIGYERDVHRRPVGLRTHLIVALAAATFMVISSQFVYWQAYGKDDLVEVDASRIAASVVSAIGFLAGGAILRNGLSIQGLTTAAGLWLVTAIGMCAGAGMYVIAVFVTMMGIAALTILRKFEDKNDNLLRRHLEVVLNDDGQGITTLVAALTGLGAVVTDLEYEKRLGEDKKRLVAKFDVQMPLSIGVPKLTECVETVPGVKRIRVQNV